MHVQISENSQKNLQKNIKKKTKKKNTDLDLMRIHGSVKQQASLQVFQVQKSIIKANNNHF